MIKVLENPKTEHYQVFKEWVLGTDFFWTYVELGGVKFKSPAYKSYFNEQNKREEGLGVPFYTRVFLRRPEILQYPSLHHAASEEVDAAVRVMKEILDYNNVEMNCILRLAVNAVHPFQPIRKALPHHDHHFDHKNFIIYLTGAGGRTFCEGKEHDPKEDDAILFEGEHHMETPAENRRVILVATMI